jgi:hypothetical protein
MELNLYDEFWFKVKIQSAKGVHAVNCEVVYPPDILEAVLEDFPENKSAVVTELGTFFSQDKEKPLLSANLENEEPGKIVVALNKFDDQPGQGAGSMFHVLFRCVGVGEGEIRFAQSRISDATDKYFPSQWTSAKVNVVGINLVSVDIVPRGWERKELDVTWNLSG